MRETCAAALLVLAAGCGTAPVRLRAPAGGAYVPGDAPIDVVADREGADALAMTVDGRDAGPLAIGTDGAFHGTLGGLAPGRHEIVVASPDLPGGAAHRTIYVDRLPPDRLDGWSFSPDLGSIVTLSRGHAADDGTVEGRLTLEALAGPPLHRELSGNGVYGEASGGAVAWLEGWRQGRGTLVVEAPGVDAVRRGGVRAFDFSGPTLAVLGDGVDVLEPPYDRPLAIAPEAARFGFLDGEGDLGVLGVGTSAQATFAAAPGYVPQVLREPVVPRVAARPGAREAALVTSSRSLIRWDLPGAAVSDAAPNVIAFGWSPDGRFLVALQSAPAGLWIQGEGLTRFFAGDFAGAIFDPEVSHLDALATDGTLLEIALEPSPVGTVAATGVSRLQPLPGGALLWSDDTGALTLRRPDGMTLPVGSLDAARPEVAFRDDLLAFAFPTVEGGLEPIRIVDVETGAAEDVGAHARRPTFLAGGAFAWLEDRSDSTPGSLANEDLWLFPTFPGSLAGPIPIASRVDASQPALTVSADRGRLAILTDLPRPGERWAANARCIAADGTSKLVGAADGDLRLVFFFPDGRLAWFGADGAEARVMFLTRC